MSSIFDNTQVPAWLTDITVPKRQGELGHTLGMALGAGLLAMQQDPSTIDPATGQTQIDPGTGKQKGWMETRKGWTQGMHEARLNEQDPNWQVKTKALEASVVNNWARAATEWQQFDATNKDMADWMTHDIPAISQFQKELKTNPEATPPVVLSTKGIQAVAQLERSQLAMQNIKFKQDNAKLALDNAKTSLAFDQAVSAAPVNIGSSIHELPNQGWNLDRQGKRTTPSTAALRIYNDWATDGGKVPEKGFGYKPNAAEVQELRNKGAIATVEARGGEARKTEGVRQENRIELENVRSDNKEDLSMLNADQKRIFEADRQKDRLEIEKAKQDGRIDLAKLKGLSRTDGSGKVISKAQFIDRHWNTVFNSLRKDNASESPSQTAARAEKILAGVYYKVDQADAPKAAPAPAPAPAPPTATTPTSTGTNDVNFDDFQKWKQGK